MNYKKIFVDTAKTTASQKAYDKVSLYHALRKMLVTIEMKPNVTIYALLKSATRRTSLLNSRRKDKVLHS